MSFDGDILSLVIAEGFPEVGGDREGDGDAIGGLLPDISYL
jgi:hypothetical protein